MTELPLAIRMILPVIAADHGTNRGETMGMLLGPGLSEIRRHLGAIDDALGSQSPGLPGLDTLVTKTERAISSSQPKVPKQHYISQVLLRHFTEPTQAGNVLARFDLAASRYLRPIGTSGVGYVLDFVPIDSETTEALWQGTESRLPQALQAVLNAPAAASTAHLETLKRTVALHFVRHPQTVASHNKAFATALEAGMQRLVNTPVAEAAFRQHHGGLLAAGPEARRIGLEEAQDPIRKLHEAGALFRISVQRLYEKVCDRFDVRDVEILVPSNPAKEFLLGDVPALTVDNATGAAGLEAGVTVDRAGQITLPVMPRLAIVIGERSGTRMISDEEVDDLNRLQVRLANDHVFHRPSADFTGQIMDWRSCSAPA